MTLWKEEHCAFTSMEVLSRVTFGQNSRIREDALIGKSVFWLFRDK